MIHDSKSGSHGLFPFQPLQQVILKGNHLTAFDTDQMIMAMLNPLTEHSPSHSVQNRHQNKPGQSDSARTAIALFYKQQPVRSQDSPHLQAYLFSSPTFQREFRYCKYRESSSLHNFPATAFGHIPAPLFSSSLRFRKTTFSHKSLRKLNILKHVLKHACHCGKLVLIRHNRINAFFFPVFGCIL